MLLRRGVLSPYTLVNPPTSIAITRLTPFCICSKTASSRSQAYLLHYRVGWYNFPSSGWWGTGCRSLLQPWLCSQSCGTETRTGLLKLSLRVWRSCSWFLSHLLLRLSPNLSSSVPPHKAGTDCQPCTAPTRQVFLELEAQSGEILWHWDAAEVSARSSFLSSAAAHIPTAGQQSIHSFCQWAACRAT